MTIVTITIPKYKKWQQETDKRRDWVAFDIGFYDDYRIEAVVEKLPDAVFCYQWLIFNCEKTGHLEISLENLKRSFMKITQSKSNRFDVLKRLQCLSNEGLIEFQCDPNELLIASQSPSNDSLIEVQSNPKGVLEPPETPVALRARTDNTIHTNNTTTTAVKASRKGSGRFLKLNLRGDKVSEDEWLFRCFLERRRSKNLSTMGCDNLDALLSLFPTHMGEYRRWLTLPDDIRMAAIVYTYVEASSDDPLKYALNVAENGTKWDKMQPLLKQAGLAIKNNDYEVDI